MRSAQLKRGPLTAPAISIPGLLVWVAADKIRAYTSTSEVARWDNLVNAQPFQAAAAPNRPTVLPSSGPGHLPVVYFSDITDALSGPTFSGFPLTHYICGRPVSWTNGRFLLNSVNAPDGSFRQTSGTPQMSFQGVGTSWTLGKWSVMSGAIRSDGGSYKVRLGEGFNVTAVSTVFSPPIDGGGVTLGDAAACADFQLAELLVYRGFHDGIQRRSVYDYLFRKWNIKKI